MTISAAFIRCSDEDNDESDELIEINNFNLR